MTVKNSWFIISAMFLIFGNAYAGRSDLLITERQTDLEQRVTITAQEFPILYHNDGYLHALSNSAQTAKRLFKGDIGIWTPDGNDIIYSRFPQGKGIVRYDPRQGTHKVIVENGWQPSLSPDQKRLAYVKDTVMHVLDMTTGDDTVQTKGYGPQWINEHTLAYVSPENNAMFFDVQTRKISKKNFAGIGISPDGKRYVSHRESGLDKRITLGPDDVGKKIGRSELFIADIIDSNEEIISTLEVVAGGKYDVFSGKAAWSPDGQRIACKTWDVTQQPWVEPSFSVLIINYSTKKIEASIGPIPDVYTVSWSADSRYLLISYLVDMSYTIDTETDEISILKLNPYQLTEDNLREGLITSKDLQKDKISVYDIKTWQVTTLSGRWPSIYRAYNH